MYSKIAVELLVLFTLSGAVLSASVAKKSNDVEQMGKEFAVLQKVYDDCQDKEAFGECLKGKALTAIARAVDQVRTFRCLMIAFNLFCVQQQESISLLDGISLVKSENSVVDDSPILADARALSGLSEVDRALVQNVEKFLRTHTVKVDLSEARGKGKKQYKYVIAAMLTAMGIAGPLGLKALAFIAGKALVISKVALTIAGIIALKKIFSSDHHEETSFQVHASEHNRRNAYLKKIAAQSGYAADPYRHYYEQQAAASQ